MFFVLVASVFCSRKKRPVCSGGSLSVEGCWGFFALRINKFVRFSKFHEADKAMSMPQHIATRRVVGIFHHSGEKIK